MYKQTNEYFFKWGSDNFQFLIVTKTGWNYLRQGFSTFWYLCTPKSKFYPSAYPQIRVVSHLRTPNQKILPMRTPCKLLLSGFTNLAYPLQTACVPLGVHVPQVENRWFTLLIEIFWPVANFSTTFQKRSKGNQRYIFIELGKFIALFLILTSHGSSLKRELSLN
jgi:hypothetical protein